MYNIKDLETEGFVVIKNFIRQSDAETYVSKLDVLQNQNQNDYNTNHQSISMSKKRKIILADFQHDISNQVHAVLKKVREETNISVDIITNYPTFFDNKLFYNGYHQDHEPYYLCQDSYNSLNFWIPILKPNAVSSGLSIVPHSTLPEDLKKILVGTGARTFVRNKNKTIITDNSTGDINEVDFDLDKYSVIPAVEPGDALVLRVDTIHKTQFPTERRIAMSVRCYNSKSKIYRDKFFHQIPEKQARIKSHQDRFNTIVDMFNKIEDDYILFGDMALQRKVDYKKIL